MCNNLSVAVAKLQPPNDVGYVTPSGSSSHLCPVHPSTRASSQTRSLSLEDLYVKPRTKSKRRKSTQIYRENSHRRSRRGSPRRNQDPTQLLSFENETNRSTSRKSSLDIPPYDLLQRTNSRRGSKVSKRSSDYTRHNSMSSYEKRTSLSLNMTEEELLKYKRRRKIVTVIIVTFGVLVFVCIMAVLVSLTHKSTVTITRNNATVNVTYYTFSPHAGIVCEHEDVRLCSQGK